MQKDNDIFNANKPKSSSLSDKYKSLDEPIVEQKRQLPPNMVACRSCGEPILRSAKICKYCNEYQNDADKRKAQADIDNFNYNNIDFSGMEWSMLLICPGIGILYGFYILFTGNTPKGIKFLKYSFFLTSIYIIIKYAFDLAMASH